MVLEIFMLKISPHKKSDVIFQAYSVDIEMALLLVKRNNTEAHIEME